MACQSANHVLAHGQVKHAACQPWAARVECRPLGTQRCEASSCVGFEPSRVAGAVRRSDGPIGVSPNDVPCASMRPVSCSRRDADLTLFTFGARFAPRPAAVAKKMVRVTKPGGRIVMCNWIPNEPTSSVTQLLRISSGRSSQRQVVQLGARERRSVAESQTAADLRVAGCETGKMP